MKKKIIVGIMILMAVVVILIVSINSKREQERRVNVVNNTIISSLIDISMEIDNLLEAYSEGEIEKCERIIDEKLRVELYVLDAKLECINTYLNGELGYNSNYNFKYIAFAFDNGLPGDDYQESIFHDQIINDNEKEFINLIKYEVDGIKDELQSSNNIESIESVVNGFISRWDINSERILGHDSPYDLLFK